MVVPKGLSSPLTWRQLLFGQRLYRKQTKVACLVASIAVGVPDGAWADDWKVTIGGGALYGPEYPGADSYDFQPVPFVDIAWRDRIFLNSQRGLGVYAVKREYDDDAAEDGSASPSWSGGWLGGLSVGVSVKPSDSRDEDDDSRLDGLGDIDLSAEVGLFASVELGPVEFEAEIYHDPGSGHEGTRGTIGAAYGTRFGERLMIEAGPFLQFGDGQYLESFFGVTAAQAGRSALPRYDAGSGLYGAGFEVMAHYQVSESWGVLGFIEYSRLVGDAADSPIVQNEDAIEVGAFVTYSF